MSDKFANRSGGLESPPTNHFDVDAQKSDTVDFVTRPRALWIGVAGDVSVVDESDTALVYTCPAGTRLDGRWKRVNTTGTTATQIRGQY